jgi:predicted O-linked N-acetylglucosamine transferase (SPINDLY family)
VAPGIFNLFKPKAAEPSPSIVLAETLDRARSLHQQGQYADALTICQENLKQQPNHVDTLFLMAEITARTGESDRAMQIYRTVLDLRPDHAPAHYKRGNLLKDQQKMEAALASYDEAIALDPGYAYAFFNRAFVLERLNRWDAALQSYDHAISLTPGDALAHYNRAAVLRELARQEEALASYTQAIALKPDYFEAYFNRGLLLTEMKQRDAALASFNRAIEINPGSAAAHCQRGSLLAESKQWSAARASLDRAIVLKPDYAEAYDSLAVLFSAASQFEAALTNFDTAIALKPDYAQAYVNRANTLVGMQRFLPAIADYDRALALKTDTRFVLGMRWYAKLQVGDWSDMSADVRRLASGIEAGEMLSPPLPVLGLVDSAPLQHKAAQIWVSAAYPSNPGLPAISRRPRQDKPRIGYFSCDFHQHPVAVLMAGVFESHDRSKFEVNAFSYGPDPQDDMRKRLETAFDRFIDVRQKSDLDIASLAREMDIDIAVDLGGHTGKSRTGIFALRAAPLQINYLGYPGTMGADYIDYLIADTTIIPLADQPHYSEKVLYLPSFQANDSQRRIADRIFTRKELALPANGFVFCCFNANYKITPDTFAGWMRILTKVPGSVLHLYANNEAFAENLKKEASSRGVDANRLIFAKGLPLPEYLARYRVADLFLDTLPYNAGATASDALWAGLPVLTCVGDAFAGKMGASLLTAIGLPELITYTQPQYEELAVALANDPQRLAAIKFKLAANRSTTLLFDTHCFAKHLEAGYSKILEKHHAGLPPEHVHVPA